MKYLRALAHKLRELNAHAREGYHHDMTNDYTTYWDF